MQSMLKKGILLAFLAGMVSAGVGGVVAQQFTDSLFPDVGQQDFFFDSVNRFARKGIIKGYDNGVFSPYDYVTRGQVAVIVDRYDQQVIAKLRQQVEQMRTQLGLGTCGDSAVQVGEECDDGNMLSGDGCSAECINEIHCSGGFKVGDRFPAPDGCNVCTCTEVGIACTEQACTQKKCFSSAECSQDQVCSVEQGDCRFPCPVGAVCIQACAGVCIPKSYSSVCGDSICDSGESAVPDRTGGTLYCPQDCNVTGPACGDNICDNGEPDEYTLSEQGPVLLRRGTCPEDCEGGGVSSCEQQKKAIDTAFANSLTCQEDEDCTVFVRGCSPYLTCGKPIRSDALGGITKSVLEYSKVCGSTEPTVCTGCLPSSAVCENNTCVLVQ